MKQYIFPQNIAGEQIKDLRNKLKMTQKEFANLANVTTNTVEKWESENKTLSGPIVFLYTTLIRDVDLLKKYELPEKQYPLRLYYMHGVDVCTLIDVDDLNRKVKIYNYTDNVIHRAFGNVENPSYKEYEEFLESRCFPRSRDNVKLYLKELDIPFYDPFMIIRKTEGRMAEDNFYIKIER